MMDYQKLTKAYMVGVVIAGSAFFATSLVYLPLERLDIQFLILAACTIGLGSRITVQIPRFKSHVAVSDTFIFLTLLLYGAELAVILSAAEAFFSSRRFCKKWLTVFFNVSTMVMSISAVAFALRAFGLFFQDIGIFLSLLRLMHGYFDVLQIHPISEKNEKDHRESGNDYTKPGVIR